MIGTLRPAWILTASLLAGCCMSGPPPKRPPQTRAQVLLRLRQEYAAPPQALTDAAASVAAAPPHASADLVGYAPQVRELGRLWKAAGEPGQLGPVRGALLLCSTATPGYTERTVTGLFVPGANAGGDLQVVLRRTVGGREVFVVGNGPRDANEALTSAPLADLSPGDRFSLEVYDRDVLSRELIDRVEMSYAGRTPFAGRGPLAEVSCRLLPRAKVEDEVLFELQRVDFRLEEFDRQLHPDPARPGYGARQQFASSEFDGLAALVGWADERLGPRLRRPAALAQRFEVELIRSLKALHEGLPPPGTWTEIEPEGLAVRFERLRCAQPGSPPPPELGARGTGCVLLMHLRNRGEQPLERSLSIAPLGRLNLVLPDGLRLEAFPSGVWRDDTLHTAYPAHPRRLEARSTVQLVYTVSGLSQARRGACAARQTLPAELLLRGVRQVEPPEDRDQPPAQATPPAGAFVWMRAPLSLEVTACPPGSRPPDEGPLDPRLRE